MIKIDENINKYKNCIKLKIQKNYIKFNIRTIYILCTNLNSTSKKNAVRSRHLHNIYSKHLH